MLHLKNKHLLLLFATSFFCALFAICDSASGQSASAKSGAISQYFDARRGLSSDEVVRRALASNSELAAARLDVERARARVNQAGLRANPTLDFEQTTGRLTGSPGEREMSIGVALPLDISGQRQRRVNLARIEMEAAEAELANRERRFISDVRIAYADALAAMRELDVAFGLSDLDLQTARIVEARVSEGESAPIELNLLRVEADRLKSRLALIEGRLQAAILKLKALAGIPLTEPLLLGESLESTLRTTLPASLESALDTALRTRPDVRLARLNEKAAEAGFQLVNVSGRPDVTAFARYSMDRTAIDDTPLGILRDKDKTLSFGVSISLPLFNKNQGAKAEAAIAINQARHRREFVEQMARAEIAGAYARYKAAQSAVGIFEQGVLASSNKNIQSIRGAYELGAFRMTELLTEQRRLLDSQRDYTEALVERYKAHVELLSAVGASANLDALKKEGQPYE